MLTSRARGAHSARMPDLFGIDIAGIVASATSGQLVPATLTKVVAGTYNATTPTSGTSPTSTSHACEVIVGELKQVLVEEDNVRRWKGEITIILGSVVGRAVPTIGSTITCTPQGHASARVFTVTGEVDIDLAGATATCSVIG
jgi:hypothetical protein